MRLSRLICTSHLHLAAALAAAAFPIAGPAPAAAQSHPSKYLFVWTGDGARKVSDFLAVLDGDPSSPTYGHVLASAAVGMTGTMPHHTEYTFPADTMLLANGWAVGTTFLFDLRDPRHPKLATTFGSVGGYSFPHTFTRLPNGHLLATFQSHGHAYRPPGGLVELDERGQFIRSASAVGPGMDTLHAWPYSVIADPAHDRALSTSTPMELPKWQPGPPGTWRWGYVDSIVTNQVQLWRLSDLALLKTITLPKAPHGNYDWYPAEPVVLPDGSYYVSTFSCGIYHITDVTAPDPHVAFVHSLPGGATPATSCAVPVVVGRFWIEPVPALPGLVALDISDPAEPVEVSRLVLDKRFVWPHWASADPNASRLVLTGNDQGYVLVVNVDPQTGALSLDRNFRDERTGAVGVSLDGRAWPQGSIAHAFVHGTVFGPR